MYTAEEVKVTSAAIVKKVDNTGLPETEVIRKWGDLLAGSLDAVEFDRDSAAIVLYHIGGNLLAAAADENEKFNNASDAEMVQGANGMLLIYIAGKLLNETE